MGPGLNSSSHQVNLACLRDSVGGGAVGGGHMVGGGGITAHSA